MQLTPEQERYWRGYLSQASVVTDEGSRGATMVSLELLDEHEQWHASRGLDLS